MHIKRLDISGVGWLAAGWQTDDYIDGRCSIISPPISVLTVVAKHDSFWINSVISAGLLSRSVLVPMEPRFMPAATKYFRSRIN